LKEIVGTAKSRIEAVKSTDPNIAFPILKETGNEITGETVGRRKHVRSSPMQMHEALIRRSDPQTPLVVPEQPMSIDSPNTRKRIGRNFPVNELSDSAAHGHPECAVVAFDQTANIGSRAWHGIDFLRIRRPAPQPSLRSRPEIAPVLI
jgi:hypothetical protein